MYNYLKYGLIAGIASSLLCFLFLIAEVSLGINPLGASKAFGYLLMFFMFFLGMRYFREKHLKGELHFPQAFLLGSFTNLFACLFYSLWLGLYLIKINPQILINHKSESKQFLISMKQDYLKSISLKSFDDGLKEIDNLMVSDIMWDEFYKRLIILMIFVLVASLIMRRTSKSLVEA